MKEERDVRISRKHTLRQGFKWLIHIKTHTYLLAVTQRTHIGNPREKKRRNQMHFYIIYTFLICGRFHFEFFYVY